MTHKATATSTGNTKTNKTKAHETLAKRQSGQHSSTNVYVGDKRFHAGRKVVSFRCNEDLWKRFKQQMKADGSSVCHMLETIISAVLGAYPELVNNRNTITIENLHVQRVVQRHRRLTHEFVGETNYYDSEATMWKYVPADPSELNVNGHVGGCGCRDCRRGVLKNV